MRLALPLSLCALALAACSQDNPLFHLVTIDAVDDSSGPGAQDTGAADTTATSEATPTSTGPEPATTTDPGPDLTTGSIEPGTTTGDEPSGTDGTTTSAASTGSTGDEPGSTTAGETTGQTTIEPMELCPVALETVYINLYPLCPSPNTEWYGSQNQATVDLECGGQNMFGDVKQHAMADTALGDPVCDVLELVPYQGFAGAVRGRFKGLSLFEAEAKVAELFTEVTCTTPGLGGTCDVQVSLWIDTDQNFELGKVTTAIKNGEVKPLTIPIHALPQLGEGQEFSVILDAKINGPADAQDRVYFVDPRIRKM